MKEFANQTPEQIGILPKYIPPQCKGKPVHEMFEIDIISHAPVEWFNNAIHHVCPIDAAYCIVKVHESLVKELLLIKLILSLRIWLKKCLDLTIFLNFGSLWFV